MMTPRSVASLACTVTALWLCFALSQSEPAFGQANPSSQPVAAATADADVDDCRSLRPQRAVVGCTRLLALTGPNSVIGAMRVNVLANRAESLLQLGRAAEALADVDVALSTDLRNPRLQIARARALAALDRDDDAIVTYTLLLRVDRRQTAGMIERGRLHQRAGRLSEARADYEEAIRRRIDRPEGYVALAEMLVAQARSATDRRQAEAWLKEAGTLLQQAAEFGFDQPEVFLARAGWREVAGADQLALEEYERAIRADRNAGEAYLGRARLRQRLGQLEAARADAAEAVLSFGDRQDVMTLARELGVDPGSVRRPVELQPVPPTDTGLPVIGEGVRMALVIGNGNYAAIDDLPNAINDGRAVAAKLRALGFVVELVENAGKEQLTKAREAFVQAARKTGAAAALIYYAGHGALHEGNSFIVPVDARIEPGIDLSGQLVDTVELVRSVEAAIPVVLFFFDGCRSLPTLPDKAMAAGAGTAVAANSAPSRALRKTAKANTLKVYATELGHTASDGSGKHSPFTESFLGHVGAPREEIETLVKRIRIDVMKQTAEKQRPELVSGISGRFFFTR